MIHTQHTAELGSLHSLPLRVLAISILDRVFLQEICVYASSHHSLDKWNGNFLTPKMLCVCLCFEIAETPADTVCLSFVISFRALCLLRIIFGYSGIMVRHDFYLSTKLLPVQHQYRVLSIAAPHCLPVIETIQYV